MAEGFDMDLVLINDKGDPPVCKVIDYGKFKYEQEKKKKENIKKQVKVEIKEVKMSYKIDQHDFDVRLRAVQKFIGDGDKVCLQLLPASLLPSVPPLQKFLIVLYKQVKIIVQFKGREMQYKELGRDLLLKLYNPVEEIATVESPPKVEGRSMMMMLGPKQKSK